MSVEAATQKEGSARGVTLREWIAFRGYASGAWLAQHLPERTARRVFRLGAGIAHALLPELRRTVAHNQSLALGEPPSSPLVGIATREAFELYARYWLESFRLPVMGEDAFRERLVFDHIERIDEGLDAGRGVIVALPHMGNWDAAGYGIAMRGNRIAAVAEELRPPRLLELFVEHRRSMGMRIVPLVEGTGVTRQLTELLADNWVVALVADRALGGRGVKVEIFERTITLPPGPAMLSLSTGAPLLVCPVSTTDDGWRCRIGAPLQVERTTSFRADVTALTQLMAAEFERAISARSVDWHMFQPFDR
ncbi:MAG TPA: phosphatidylinositol mannoside acyltransferase [Actinomycetota bacterium]